MGAHPCGGGHVRVQLQLDAFWPCSWTTSTPTGAVTMDDPDADGGIERLRRTRPVPDLRRAPASPQFAEATLDLISDRIGRLVGAYEVLVVHSGYQSDAGGAG
ncbi:hypothetical protein AB0D37_39705 [Streptomyces sp. NPDC048384]|uniref:hypothetical protein n=1 Tax=Streptomyces sp. NPDC048384 TaxID=3155487 RepID=UPI00342D0452